MLHLKTQILSLGFLFTFICVGYAGKGECITNKVKVSTAGYMELICRLRLCDYDTAVQKEDHLYGYCDPRFYNVYDLSLSKNKKEKLLLIEVTHNTGIDGYDYYILEEHNQKIEKLNFFKGYLACIEPASGRGAAITFHSLTDHGKLKIRLDRKGKYYHRSAILDVTGTDVHPQNKNALLKKYRSEAEASYIEAWND